MTKEWIATEWQREADHKSCELGAVTITRMRSPFYEGERYAVRRLSRCLSLDGTWEREPIPSSRDDAFYDRCRFPTFVDAVTALDKAKRRIA